MASAKDRASKRASGTQRQAEYRRRHLVDPSSLDAARLNMIVTIGAKRALERLSERYGVTQRVFIERLIAEAEQEATASMSRTEQKKYYSAG